MSEAKKVKGFSVDAKARFLALLYSNPGGTCFSEKNAIRFCEDSGRFFHISPGRFGLIFKTTGAFLRLSEKIMKQDWRKSI